MGNSVIHRPRSGFPMKTGRTDSIKALREFDCPSTVNNRTSESNLGKSAVCATFAQKETLQGV